MQSFTIPKGFDFDGGKFEARYGLSGIKGEFYISGDQLVCLVDIPTTNPILESPDPVVVQLTVKEELDAIKIRLASLESKVP